MAIEIFKLFGSIMVDNKEANNQLDQTDKKAKGVGNTLLSTVGKAAKFGAGVATAAGGVTAALLGTASAAADSLDEIQKGAQKLGLSYENYQLLSYAADRFGASIENLSKGMKNITKDLGDFKTGSEDAAEAYEALGVSLQNADGSLKSAEDVMLESIYALADLADETERNTAAQQIFGNGYTELLPLLNSGSEGIKDLMQNCKDLGLVMSDDAVESGAEFGDALADVKDSISAVWTEISVDLLPVFKDLLTWVKDNMPEIKKIVSDAWNGIKDAVQVAWDILSGIVDFVVGIVTGDWSRAWDGLYRVVSLTVDKILDKINPLNGVLEELGLRTSPEDRLEYATKSGMVEHETTEAGVEIETQRYRHTRGATGGRSPFLADGGLISYPGTAIVGEDGPELLSLPRGAMVTPLNNNNNAFVETNKKLDKLIELMAASIGRPMGVYINGQALVGQIRDDMDTALGELATAEGRGF